MFKSCFLSNDLNSPIELFLRKLQCFLVYNDITSTTHITGSKILEITNNLVRILIFILKKICFCNYLVKV